MCDIAARANSQVRCEEDGRFELLQCRIAEGSDMRRCFCANQTNGNMVDGTMRTVVSRDDLPDCECDGRHACSVLIAHQDHITVGTHPSSC